MELSRAEEHPAQAENEILKKATVHTLQGTAKYAWIGTGSANYLPWLKLPSVACQYQRLSGRRRDADIVSG